jgi:hypothetical protein
MKQIDLEDCRVKGIYPADYLCQYADRIKGTQDCKCTYKLSCPHKGIKNINNIIQVEKS